MPQIAYDQKTLRGPTLDLIDNAVVDRERSEALAIRALAQEQEQQP